MTPSRLQQLLKFLESTPNDSFLTFALAKEYEQVDEWEKALQHYLKLIENDPEYVGTYYHLGKLYERQEAFDKAFFIYKKGMEIAREIGDQHALNELAAAKLNLGEEEDFE